MGALGGLGYGILKAVPHGRARVGALLCNGVHNLMKRPGTSERPTVAPTGPVYRTGLKSLFLDLLM